MRNKVVIQGRSQGVDGLLPKSKCCCALLRTWL